MKSRGGIVAVGVVAIAALAWWLWPSGDGARTSSSSASGSAFSRPSDPTSKPRKPSDESPGKPGDESNRSPLNPATLGGSSDGSVVGMAVDAGRITDPARLAEVEAWMKRNAAEAEQAVDRFCEDNDKLREKRLFPEMKGDRDAAAYMAPRIDWEGGVRPPGMLHLAEPLWQKIKAAGDDWPLKLSAQDSVGLDFDWFKELGHFDTWSVAEYGPLRDDPSTNFFETPIPNYMHLVGWVKLRLVRGMAANDGAGASAEVRQLAALISTSGLVIADAIAVHILKLDARARAVASTRGVSVEGWPELDPDQALRFRRVVLSAPYLFAPGVSEDVIKKARRCLAQPCSALAEGLGIQLALAPYAKQQNGEVVEGAVRGAKCSERLFETVRRAKPVDPETLIKDFGGANRLQEFYGPDAGR